MRTDTGLGDVACNCTAGASMRVLGEHGAVLGARMGGLLAARVLSGAYRRVTVMERDGNRGR